jgi:hypothetical protein
MPDDIAEFIHCYSEARDAILTGKCPVQAAAHWLRPDGVLTWADRQIADRAVDAARRDLGTEIIAQAAE